MKSNHNPNYHFYNKELRPPAHTLRYQMTKAEACLWKYVLRAGTMKGYTFRRQRPVLDYIADFMCRELMLVIEVDGLTHDDVSIQSKDDAKQKALENVGFTVLRFKDTSILNDIDNVSRQIEDWIEVYEKEHDLNPPTRQRGTRK